MKSAVADVTAVESSSASPSIIRRVDQLIVQLLLLLLLLFFLGRKHPSSVHLSSLRQKKKGSGTGRGYFFYQLEIIRRWMRSGGGQG
mmetsp:Transcript_20543/g.44394  ORF Transcript_20543/g.44394 Transcript_20543/m.44394 type:complete len:87 (-) Transcript_20543:166-426(-)